MPTRRLFLAATAALVAADLMSTNSAAGSSGTTPATPVKPKPAATPTPPPAPSATARCLAKHMQASLKEAKLDDAITEKIAGDIDGYLDLGKAFRAQKLGNSDEPDFIFSAVEGLKS
ncbi:MAG TPA: hypothetical protein VJN22_04290 [Candidatus Eremiobacteraceae bacterium]|nr:hypothetical protein [Candidatus Eremiobacteraceae bacterium]